jgi:two-component system chemotaxis sensor kinase CheA
MEVIVKPLEGVLEGMPGFSGTALLGDGGVLLILDLQEMLRCR